MCEKKRRTIDRRPLERVLPPAVLASLRQAGAAGAPATPAVARQIAHDLHLEERFGLSPRRVLNYMKRVMTEEPRQNPTSGGPRSTRGLTDDDRLAAHRLRQGSIAAILESCFGGPASQKPELWEKRAYLMLIGLVYERLATSAEDISSPELSTLAKVLVDARRAFGASGPHDDGARSPACTRSQARQLPKSFREAVQQVYGTRLPEPLRQHAMAGEEEGPSTE